MDRFVGRTQAISYEEEYEMIAQGGGDFRKMHRCAGEWITLHTLRVFSDFTGQPLSVLKFLNKIGRFQ